MSEHDPLEEAREGMSEAEAKAVETLLTLKRQAEAILAMPEMLAHWERVLTTAEECRDRTFGDEHFMWAGQCIAAKAMLTSLRKAAEFQPQRGKKNASQYC